MLAVLLSAMFMAQFDFFVVNVAAPSFVRDLHASPAALELVVGGYAFTYATGMITGGRLGDLYGYRRLFLIGMIAFALTSLLCGIALNPAELIVGRLLQGFAGAVMVPQVLAVITATVPAQHRPRALGWYGVAGGLGSIAGQVLGGLLLDVNVLGLGWRVIFLINVPVGAVASLLALRLLPRITPPHRARLDPLGALGIAVALGLVLAPLALGRGEGWPAWTWICMAAAVPVGALTLYWQRVLGARGGQPVLDMTLFRRSSYLAGMIAGTAFMAYFGSFMFTLTLLLQGGLGLTAFDAGLAFAPMGVLFGVTAFLGSRLVRRFGMGAMLVGGAVTCVGLLTVFGELVTGGTSLAGMILALSLVGAGNGIVMPQLVAAALVTVEPHQAGIGAGVLTTTQQFASSAGVAAVGTVFFAIAGSSAPAVGYPHGMAMAAVIGFALMLVVIGLTAVIRRIARAHR